MTSNVEQHPGHHSIRLKRRDYSAPDIYFVTICTREKRCTLGRVFEGAMIASPLGEIVRQAWNEIPEHFDHVKLPGFALMPNHVHGLIEMGRRPREIAPLSENDKSSAGELRKRSVVVAGSLGAVVRSLKAVVTKRAHGELRIVGEVWQRNYFERVVRDRKELSDTCRYLLENPLMWDRDQENPTARSVERPL